MWLLHERSREPLPDARSATTSTAGTRNGGGGRAVLPAGSSGVRARRGDPAALREAITITGRCGSRGTATDRSAGSGTPRALVTQIALHEGRRLRVHPSRRHRDPAVAVERGCAWAGDSTERPPEPLDAAILFAAVSELMPLALAAVTPGGSVMCAEIHLSDIPSFAYELLWGERIVRSVRTSHAATARSCSPSRRGSRSSRRPERSRWSAPTRRSRPLSGLGRNAVLVPADPTRALGSGGVAPERL